jgi:hypothetical protein
MSTPAAARLSSRIHWGYGRSAQAVISLGPITRARAHAARLMTNASVRTIAPCGHVLGEAKSAGNVTRRLTGVLSHVDRCTRSSALIGPLGATGDAAQPILKPNQLIQSFVYGRGNTPEGNSDVGEHSKSLHAWRCGRCWYDCHARMRLAEICSIPARAGGSWAGNRKAHSFGTFADTVGTFTQDTSGVCRATGTQGCSDSRQQW